MIRNYFHKFCFNPCFSGFTSTTTLEILRRLYHLKFQSLFFWIHFYNKGLTRRRGPNKIVSILVFLDSLLQPDQYTGWRQAQDMVSILVFWIHFYN